MGRRDEAPEQAVAAGLDEVWRLLTTSEGLSSWFGTEAQVDARVGGTYRVSWGRPDEAIVGTVTEIEAPHRLRVAYLHEGREMGGEEWLLTRSDSTS